MAIQVLAGIPWLAAMLSGMFGSLVGFFAKYVTMRLAVIAAVVSAIVALTAAFAVAMNALINSILPTMPALVITGFAHLCPESIELILGAVFSAHVVRYAYEWNVKVIQYRLF